MTAKVDEPFDQDFSDFEALKADYRNLKRQYDKLAASWVAGVPEIRIEALRAAAVVVAAQPWWRRLMFRGQRVAPGKGTLLLAEQFRAWLEEGK